MRAARSNQAGFSIVEAVLVVAVIGIMGAAGWFVYQHNRTLSTGATSNPNPSSNQQTITPSTTPAPTVSYLAIKEWGLKLPLSDSIKDAYYTVEGSNNGADGLPNTAWLGLTSLNSTGCNISTTGPSATASPVGSILRVLPTDRDPVSGELYTQQYPNGATVGGYYYAYKPWNNRHCASATTLQSIDSAFATSAKGSATAAN
jgi:Prokaryotic N-terminal methylation motif